MSPASCALRAALTLPFLFACQIGSSDLEIGESNQEILGGTPISPGQFPTVVAMAIEQGRRGLCTGTLVGPDLVLTAAHCVDPRIAGYATQDEVTRNTLVIVDSSDLSANGSAVAVASTARISSFNNPGDPDVGIIRLRNPINGRAYSRVNLQADKAPAGTVVTMVGYGVADNGQAGKGFVLTNRSSINCQNGVNGDLFHCYNQTDGRGKCSGDSGGPSFAMIDGVETVVGITSFGDQNCEVLGADYRADASRGFFAQEAPDLLCGADDYCEPMCGAGIQEDPDCRVSCANDDECFSGQICNLNDSTCIAGPDAPGGLGAPCGDGLAECSSSICASRGDDQVCTQLCSVDAQDCPTGFECLNAGDQGACFADGDGGGCSVGGASGGGLASLLVLIGLLAMRRRRD